MPSVHLMKWRKGGSGGCGPWLELVCTLEGLPPQVLTSYNAFLGSPGSANHSENCSELYRKLPISKDLITFKINVGGFSAGTGRCPGVERQAGKCPGDQQVVLRPPLSELGE